MPSTEQTLTNYKSSETACVFLLPDSPRFTIIDANEAYLSMTGKKLNQLIGGKFFDVFPLNKEETNLKHAKAVRASLEKAYLLKKKSKMRLQRYDLQLKDETGFITKFWNTDTIPILDNNNKVLYLVHTAVDVTEFISQQAKSPEDGVLFHENFAHPLFNDYPDGVATLDLYGNFLSVNRIFIDQSEYEKEDLLSMSFVPLIGEKDFARTFEFFQKSIKGEIQNFEGEMVNSTGNRLMLNITFLPIIVNNEVLGVYLISKDLTSLKEAEQQAEKHKAQVITMLESITDGFFSVDNDWIVTYFNKEAEKILSIARDKVIGKNLWDIFPEAVQLNFFSSCQHAMKNKVTLRFEEFLPSANVWLEIAVYPNEGGLSAYFSNVTARMNAAMELQKAKERYEKLFDFSPFPLWVYDINTLGFLAVNTAAINAYGYSEEEFLRLKVGDLYPEEEKGTLNRMLEAYVKPRLVNQSTVRLVKRSGEQLTAEINSQPLPSWSENARIIVAQDVTETIRAQKALRASEQRFKALVQDGSDLTAILDISGTFKYVSPSTKRILNIEPEVLMHKNIFDFIFPEDKVKVMEDFAQLSTLKSIQIAPFRVFSGANQYRWIETMITDLSNDEAVAGIVINARDVTERMKNERKIKASIEQYNRISRANTNAIYDWDLQTNELKWSKGFHELFGYSNTQEEKQANWLDLIHPEDRERVIDLIYVHLRDKKTRWKQQYRFMTADGLYKAVLDQGFINYSADGRPERMIGAMQDVTERFTYISNSEQQNKLLKEISWMQSHIVRAPLARIMNLSELLTYNEGQITNTELLTHLTDSAQELDKIISAILIQTDKN
jgi:PAS domain S-box-containing protein